MNGFLCFLLSVPAGNQLQHDIGSIFARRLSALAQNFLDLVKAFHLTFVQIPMFQKLQNILANIAADAAFLQQFRNYLAAEHYI